MTKYVSPKIKIEELRVEDVMETSGAPVNGVTYGQLEGVDTESSKSAIFNAGFWFD